MVKSDLVERDKRFKQQSGPIQIKLSHKEACRLFRGHRCWTINSALTGNNLAVLREKYQPKLISCMSFRRRTKSGIKLSHAPNVTNVEVYTLIQIKCKKITMQL